MEVFKCSITECFQRGLNCCKCTTPPGFYCENHKGIHSGHSTLSQIPESYVSYAELKILHLDDICSSGQKYLFPSGTSQYSLFKYEIVPKKLPEDYQEFFHKAIWHFIQNLRTIPRDKSEHVLIEEKKLFKTLQKKVLNFSYQIGSVNSLFIATYNKRDDSVLNMLLQFIDDNKGYMFLNDYSGFMGLGKKFIDEEKENFHNLVRQGSCGIEKMIELFRECFKNFVLGKAGFEEKMKDIREGLFEMDKRIREEGEKEIFKLLSSSFNNKEFVQFVFYQDRQFSGFKNQIFKPDWFPCENLLLIKEKILISDTQQLSPGSYISLMVFTESKKSFLLSISDFSVSRLLVFEETNLIIASGISSDSLVLIQNYPKQLYFFSYDGKNISPDSSKNFTTETTYNIISIAYMNWKDSVLFITTENDLREKYINNDLYPRKIEFKLEYEDKLLDVQVKTSKRMIFLRTSIYFVILDDSFSEIFRFKSLGSFIDIFDDYHSLNVLFVGFYNEKIRSLEIVLSEDQQKKFGFKLEEDNMLKKTLSSLINYFKKSVQDDNANSHYNEFDEFTLHPLSVLTPDSVSVQKSIPESKSFWCNPLTDNNSLASIKQVLPIQKPDPTKININPFEARKILPEKAFFEGHCRICGEEYEENVKTCQKVHYCNEICEYEGACSTFGKNHCQIELPKNVLRHSGPHKCSSEFHSCFQKCPVKDCIVYCTRKIGHKGIHKCEIHFSLNGVSCNNECFNANHKHFVECECKDVKSPWHCANENMDMVECEEFWKKYNWEALLKF